MKKIFVFTLMTGVLASGAWAQSLSFAMASSDLVATGTVESEQTVGHAKVHLFRIDTVLLGETASLLVPVVTMPTLSLHYVPPPNVRLLLHLIRPKGPNAFEQIEARHGAVYLPLQGAFSMIDLTTAEGKELFAIAQGLAAAHAMKAKDPTGAARIVHDLFVSHLAQGSEAALTTLTADIAQWEGATALLTEEEKKQIVDRFRIEDNRTPRVALMDLIVYVRAPQAAEAILDVAARDPGSALIRAAARNLKVLQPPGLDAMIEARMKGGETARANMMKLKEMMNRG